MASKMKEGFPQADGSIAVEPTMAVINVADAVVYMVNLPPEVHLRDLTTKLEPWCFIRI